MKGDAMLKNIFKIAFRNIRRQKGYSVINIVGLSVGLAISLTLALYVVDDLTFDRFHKEPHSIYRILQTSNAGGIGARTSVITSGPMVPTARENIPEIAEAVLTFEYRNLPIRIPTGENAIAPNVDETFRARVLVTEPDFFDIYNFKILSGDAQILATPNGVLITPEFAATLFGDENPLNRSLEIPTLENSYVAGMIEAPPFNSHIQYDMIIPLHEERNPIWWNSWENQTLSGYVKLHEGTDPKIVANKMEIIAKANGYPEVFTVSLQPLLDIHMKSKSYYYDTSNFGRTDVSMVITLGIIGIMIILIASINFINLSSARASRRAREVGMRKVVGSQRWQLISQFLAESVVMTLFATILAVVLLQITLPLLADFLGKQMDMGIFFSPLFILLLLGTAILIGLLAGLYPAFIISSFRPLKILKGEFQTSRSGTLLRRFLVVFQFSITIALIFGVSTVLNQIRFLKTMDMGYNRDQVLFAPTFGIEQADLLKTKLLSIPGIKTLGRTNGIPATNFVRAEVRPEGYQDDRITNWAIFYVDEGFFPTLDVTFIQGRNVSDEHGSDIQDAVVINETAAKFVGWDDPIGKRIDVVLDDIVTSRRIVGVVKDFHYATARQRIEPMCFLHMPERSGVFLMRLGGGTIPETRDKIASIYKEVRPDFVFRYRFLDEVYEQQFNQDKEFAGHVAFFSGIAVLIACLGLLGLVSYAVEQRQKEIAVRKILGCSEKKILVLLIFDFLKWVILANLIAWPLGYFSMGVWLNGFTYRLPFQISPFLIASAIALLLAMITVTFHTIKAANYNPAQILRQDT
ncbi:FtsX-like permease family protein [Acidobacteriota bacterium]